jgi:hypothetical protein
MRTAVACPDREPERPATYTAASGAYASAVVTFWPSRYDPERRALVYAQALTWWTGSNTSTT